MYDPMKSGLTVGTPIEEATVIPAPKGTTPASQSYGRTAVSKLWSKELNYGVLAPAAKMEGSTAAHQVVQKTSKVLQTTTRKSGGELMDLAKNIAKRNPREMGIAAAGLLLGVGTYEYNRHRGNKLR